ncbi:uncharacterized protein LOC115943361 [Leptonychotes weddellii]|uniref:Uncharacterized protein LOC115943361 n=1 Tax=Leptonychotes weddellii TaxID=9713 RepID=A0A7F8RE98_LEPWE|nr:uncharacterized protein LOC115943361 [Leptonychotes weddellii]
MQVIFAAKTVERRGAYASALTLTHSHVGPVALNGRALGGPAPGPPGFPPTQQRNVKTRQHVWANPGRCDRGSGRPSGGQRRGQGGRKLRLLLQHQSEGRFPASCPGVCSAGTVLWGGRLAPAAPTSAIPFLAPPPPAPGTQEPPTVVCNPELPGTPRLGLASWTQPSDTVPSSQLGPQHYSRRVSYGRPLPPPGESSHNGTRSFQITLRPLLCTVAIHKAGLYLPPPTHLSPLHLPALFPAHHSLLRAGSRRNIPEHSGALPAAPSHYPDAIPQTSCVRGPAKPLRSPPTCLCSQHLSLSGVSQPGSPSTCSLHWKLVCPVHRGPAHGPSEQTQ